MLDTGQLPLSGTALAIFRQGLAFAVTENYAKAVENYNQVLRLNPDCAEVWYECGLALENLGAYYDAIARYDQALQLQPNDTLTPEVWHSRGNALQYGLGDYVAAIKSYDRALQAKPDAYLIWQNRGNALLYGLGRYEEAIANYDRALLIDADCYQAWRNRGNALVELSRYEEAISSYDQALAIEPNDQISSYARTAALNRGGFEERQPTTNPVWYGRGYNNSEAASNLTAVDAAYQETLVSHSENQAGVSYPQPTLVVEDDNGRREIVLSKDRYCIGRDPKNEIHLRSQFVSRHHATLVRLPQDNDRFTYQIIDGDSQGKRSTNGLLINGRKQPVWDLQHEDVVILGPNVRVTYCSESIVV